MILQNRLIRNNVSPKFHLSPVKSKVHFPPFFKFSLKMSEKPIGVSRCLCLNFEFLTVQNESKRKFIDALNAIRSTIIAPRNCSVDTMQCCGFEVYLFNSVTYGLRPFSLFVPLTSIHRWPGECKALFAVLTIVNELQTACANI